MDTEQVRHYAHEHGQSVVRGDMENVFGDLHPDLREAMQAQGPPPDLPERCSAAEVASVEDGGEHCVVAIGYTDASNGELVTVRSKWETHGDRPYISEILSVEK